METDILLGTGHKVRVTRSETVALPASGSTDRVELDRRLKERGRWEEVSVAQHTRVRKLLERGLAEEEQAYLEECVVRKESVRVTLSKR